jgi:colanic acid/amylovoran biosynthesis glycosyltransferase
MRVGFVVNRFPLVSEVFIMNTAAALLEQGCDVEIFALDGQGQIEILNEPGRRHDLMARTHVVMDTKVSRLARWRAAPPVARAMVREHGFGALASSLDLRHHRRRAVSTRALSELALFKSRPPFDLFHCQFGTLGEKMRRHVSSRGLDAPLVVHFRGHDLGPYVQRQGPDCYRQLFATARQFIANSAYFRERAVALGCPPDRIRVIESPVDIDSFPWRAPQPDSNRPLRLLTVGRLVEKKGIAYAIEAAALLKARGHALSYRIIGEGDLRADLQARIAALGLVDSVTLEGSRSHGHIAQALNEADLFLAPSVVAANGDADAAINTIKEAMLVGVPVVATRHGGIPELVCDEDTGLLVPERDAAGLAQAVERLVAAPDRWARMSRAARLSVETRFGMPQIAAQTLRVYQDAVAGQAPGGV